MSRIRVEVRGVVQGVGFRPFIYNLARSLSLKGWVRNTSGKVEIEAEGERVFEFLRLIKEKAPPMAKIDEISYEELPPKGYESFEIIKSLEEEGYQLLSPDIATCEDCVREIFDPGDRRYMYPFTNCTNCGPRFTIIEDIPYDREKTTMKVFRMCPECEREYNDPTNRRFHAQPNACPVCGPKLWLEGPSGVIDTDDPIDEAVRLIREGNIVAIKGLGGFLLACDARNREAVRKLRERKRRPSKPFALMMRDMDEVKRYCDVSEEEERLLKSPESPIVLLRWREKGDIDEGVAPNLRYLGVMLPYTPIHHILMRKAGFPLIMTSGNLSEEPIAKDNDEAKARLKNIADFFLLHNRDIRSRYDDSVVMVEDEPCMIRRARGYAPYPIHLPFEVKRVLACGAELKNTFCLTNKNHAFISQHIGDMENEETLSHFIDTIELYKKLFRIEPELVACDLHPDYLSTIYAESLGKRLVRIQHHFAHVVSCLAERGIDKKVIGVSMDGLGYGEDGAMWGGEFLVSDMESYERIAHLEYVPLPGGEASIKKPWRMALSYILTLLGDVEIEKLPLYKFVNDVEAEVVKKQIKALINTPMTSSMGRLFDGVSALIGVRGEIDYEGQAAVELEMIAEGNGKAFPFDITEGPPFIIRLGKLFEAIIEDDEPPQIIAGRFHITVAEMIKKVCELIRGMTGIKDVVLTGGVFQNRLLLRLTKNILKESGFEVITHRKVPPNDGGISLGQAVACDRRA